MKNSFLDYIKNLFKETHGYAHKYKKVILVSSLIEVPENTKNNVYLVGNSKTYKWVVFMCPNNCGKRVEVNLMKARYPNWRLSLKKKKASLYPSIIVEDCGAHFWLTDNGVLFAKDDYESYQS